MRQRVGHVAHIQLADLDDVLQRAARVAPPGGCVLFSPACASFDMFSDYAARGRAFQRAVRAVTER